nr:ATP-binding protein [Planobispora longispora]
MHDGHTDERSADSACVIGVDDLPDGLVVIDRDGHVLAVNRAAARLTGVTPSGPSATTCATCSPSATRTAATGGSGSTPTAACPPAPASPSSRCAPRGHELLVAARLVREPERGGEVVRVVVTLRDAGARARLERSRADLVSTVAHELRSPLTSVKGFTATLLSKWTRFTDDQKLVMLETVNADADRVTRLITELLDVSRIESGRLEIHRQVVDVPARVRKIIAGRVAAGESEDRFALEVRGELPETWLDQDKIDQVLANLVENALRHGRGTVTIVVEPSEWGVTVSVRDQGEGIPPELATRVFRQFWRGNARRRGGTGLGLFIVKGLIEAHGGAITVQRGPEGGAEFRFMLPTGTPDFA